VVKRSPFRAERFQLAQIKMISPLSDDKDFSPDG